jgi:hypothetical protein
MPEAITAVDTFYDEAIAVLTALRELPDVSLQVTAGNHFRKALLLASASYFERRVCDSVLDFTRQRAVGSTLVPNFLRNKAISRQYHSWFSWDASNANAFFALFGDEFKTMMIGRVKASDDLQSSVRAFLELGNERNRLVHQDYATFSLEKTMDEVYALYKKASLFVDQLPGALMECDANAAASMEVVPVR